MRNSFSVVEILFRWYGFPDVLDAVRSELNRTSGDRLNIGPVAGRRPFAGNAA